MATIIILSLIYLIGVNICHWMLTTEHNAEGQVFTHGDKAACLLLSILSWVSIMWMLVATWIGKIRDTGYWNKSVKDSLEHIDVVVSANGKQTIKPKVKA